MLLNRNHKLKRYFNYKNMRKNTLFMAFSAGKESTDAGEFKKYVGVAPVKVLAVNPNKKQLDEIFGGERDKEPEYTSVVKVNDKDVKAVRISFVVRTTPEKSNGVETTNYLTFFLRNAPKVGSQSGKYQIIDNYGRTAWATKEDIDAKRIPQYNNGPANISSNYRVAYDGEEALTKFLKAYLVIDDPAVYDKDEKVWRMKEGDELKSCEARLDNIAKYFDGDVSELQELVKYLPNNEVKVLFGVKKGSDGVERQTIYTNLFVKNKNSKYITLFEKELAEHTFQDTTYEVCALKEYKPEPTNLEDMPIGESVANPWNM